MSSFSASTLSSSGRRFFHLSKPPSKPASIFQNPAKACPQRVVLYAPTRTTRKMGLKEQAPRPGEKYAMQKTHGYVAPFEPPSRNRSSNKAASTKVEPVEFPLSPVLTAARAEMRKQMEIVEKSSRPDPFKTYKEQVTAAKKKLQASIDIFPRTANVRNFGRKKGGFDTEKVAKMEFFQTQQNDKTAESVETDAPQGVEDPWKSKKMHWITPGEKEILRAGGHTLGKRPERKFPVVPKTHSAIVRRIGSAHTEAAEAGMVPKGGDFVFRNDRAQRREHRLQHERKISEARLENLMNLYHRAENFVTEENLDQKIADFLIEENLSMGATLDELLAAHEGSDDYYSVPNHVKARPTQLKDVLEGTILGGKISVQSVKEFQLAQASA